MPKPSPLWHPGDTHALIDTLASGEVGRIVGREVEPVPTDGEAWIDSKSCLRDDTRLVQRPQLCQGSGKLKMCHWLITIGLNASPQPNHRLVVGPKVYLGDADKHHPSEGKIIARREAKRLVDMGLGFLAAP